MCLEGNIAGHKQFRKFLELLGINYSWMCWTSEQKRCSVLYAAQGERTNNWENESRFTMKAAVIIKW